MVKTFGIQSVKYQLSITNLAMAKTFGILTVVNKITVLLVCHWPKLKEFDQ